MLRFANHANTEFLFFRINDMIKLIFIIFLSIFSFASYADSILEKADRDELMFVPKDDPDMAKAMLHAKSTLSDFLEVKNKPSDTQQNFSIKIGIADGENKEFFWVGQFEETSSGNFVGILNNEPRSVRNVQNGQKINFKKEDIVDWLYIENGKMKGNFTACALIKNKTVSEQEEFKRAYGLECNI